MYVCHVCYDVCDVWGGPWQGVGHGEEAWKRRIKWKCTGRSSVVHLRVRCFVLLNRYWNSVTAPGFHHKRAERDTPTIRDRQHPSSRPSLDNLVCLVRFRSSTCTLTSLTIPIPSSSSSNGPTTSMVSIVWACQVFVSGFHSSRRVRRQTGFVWAC